MLKKIAIKLSKRTESQILRGSIVFKVASKNRDISMIDLKLSAVANNSKEKNVNKETTKKNCVNV